METVVRVSRHRKCPGSVDLIRAEGDWIKRREEHKPPYGISCYMLSFGDLDNPELDCEIYLTVFEIHKLREYLNGIDISRIPNCIVKPQKLDIMVKAAADGLETCSMCGESLSKQMHCYVWEHNSRLGEKDKGDNFWVLEFIDFHLGYGGDKAEYRATQIQIECASFQLAELRGAVNGLLQQVEKERKAREQLTIDREVRDKGIRDKKEKERKKRVSVITAAQASGHRGSC